MTTTTISNQFTGFFASIRTNGAPAIATIRKHLRRAKSSDCSSVTSIFCDGVGLDVVDGRLVDNGSRLVVTPERLIGYLKGESNLRLDRDSQDRLAH